MSKDNDGGPAFPSDPYIDHPAHGLVHKAQVGYQPYDGMSLRDWFAGHALSGLLVMPRSGFSPTDIPKFAAVNAYEIADAMIAERSK